MNFLFLTFRFKMIDMIRQLFDNYQITLKILSIIFSVPDFLWSFLSSLKLCTRTKLGSCGFILKRTKDKEETKCVGYLKLLQKNTDTNNFVVRNKSFREQSVLGRYILPF